jgi:tRNA nucleotidyltransferase (CCA-adding enzyme)
MLSRLNDLGILHAIHPALPWDRSLEENLQHLDTENIDPVWALPEHSDHLDIRQTLSYLLWLGHLPQMTLRSITSRLRFKSDLKNLLIATSKLVRTLPNLMDASPSAAVRELEGAPRLAIYAVYLINSDPELRELLRMYITKWIEVEPATTGDDLRKMGLKPSPAYGQILTALRDAWLDGEINSTAQEKKLLNELLAEIE